MFWKTTINVLMNRGVDSDALGTMLSFVDAFEPPIELQTVLSGFSKTLPYISTLIPHYPTNDASLYHEEWKKICQKILTAPEFTEPLENTRKAGKQPLRGHYDDSPIYVALWYRPKELDLHSAYYHLLAHILIITRILRDRESEQEYRKLPIDERDDYKTSITSALLAVRNLGNDENKLVLRSLADLQVPPEQLLSKIREIPALEKVCVIIKFLLKLRKQPHRQKRDQQKEPELALVPHLDLPANTTETTSNLDPDQTGAFCASLMQLPQLTTERAKEIERDGCSSNEEISAVEIIVPRVRSTNNKHPRSSGQKAQEKRKVKTKLSMLNQRLTSRWEILSLYEVSSCLSAIADIIVNKDKSVYLPKDIHPIELAALLTTLFWLGQRVEDAIKFSLYTHPPDKEDKEPGFAAIAGSQGYWWMKPATPLRLRLPDEKQQSQACHTVSHFSLCSSIGIEQIISDYIAQEHKNRSRYLFSKKLEIYQVMISKFTSLVNSRHATRLTANRISDYLFDVIERHPGADLTAAMYIIGREHFLGRNPSYYTAITTSKLQSIYQNVCKDIRDCHFKERPREGQIKIDVAFNLQQEKCSDFIGSPFCPTPATVQGLVVTLKESLSKATAAPSGILKLLRLHNSMTRYTAFMIAYGTGFRAVRDPFLSAAEIDWKTGFAVLSDKDNEDGYNSRLIWIPPDCLQQLMLFKEHQKNLLCRLSILIPNIQSRLKNQRSRSPKRFMFYTMSDAATGEYLAKPLSPKLLGQKLRDIFALPINASRHYLRSTMLDRGCPVEVINAFMGHFERGEEPWGKFSGLSPIAYRDALDLLLTPLMRDDGWKPMPGLGALL